MQAVELAQAVLRDASNPIAVLSIGRTEPFDTRTPIAEVRRAYVRLAAQIHPDKLSHSFPDATKAFQAAVQAFDRFAAGDFPSVASAPQPKRSAPRSSKSARPEGGPASPPPLAAAPSPVVPVSQPAPKERLGKHCFLTPMACPNCKTFWQPDTPKQYTLVMAHNAKVHCETCVLAYGWATAHHYCPLCRKPAEFDREQYDHGGHCTHCRRDFQYARHSIDERVLAELARKRAQQESEDEARKAREQRLARRGGGEGSQDVDLLVGECMVEERCPLCRKTVKSKHRDHVLNCIKAGVVPPPPPPTVVEGEGRRGRPNPKPAARAPVKKTRAETAPTTKGPQAPKRTPAPKRALAPKRAPAPKAAKARTKRVRDVASSDDSSDWGSDGTD